MKVAESWFPLHNSGGKCDTQDIKEYQQAKLYTLNINKKARRQEQMRDYVTMKVHLHLGPYLADGVWPVRNHAGNTLLQTAW